MNENSNLFLCLTPLHVLTAIICEDRKECDHVVLLDQKGVLLDFFSTVACSGMLKSFVYVDSSSSLANFFSYIVGDSLTRFLSLSKAVIKFKKENYNHVYIFNDLSPEVQYFLCRINCKRVAYIEDGSAPYNSHCISRGWVKKNVLRLFFDGFYDPVNVLGTSVYVDYGIYSWPKLVREENRFKPSRQLIYARGYSCMMEVLAERYRDDWVKLLDRKEKCLIYLPSSCPGKSAKFISDVKKDLLSSGESDLMLLVKSHPLAQGKIEMDENVEGDVVFCRKATPGELVPVIFKNIKCIYGQSSTSLMNARKIYQNLRVVNLIDSKKEKYDEFLEVLGVTCKEVS